MNGYEINAAVRAAMAARKKAWLAALTSGSEVCVTAGVSATTAVVVRLTATQLVLSNDCRANRESGTLRGMLGSICELGAAEIEREERAKIVAAAERLAERVAYSLSEVQNGRNNESLAAGDAVVTADGQTGIVARLYSVGGVAVVLDKLDYRGRQVQATFENDRVYKLLAAVDKGVTRSTTPGRARWLQSLVIGDYVIEQKIDTSIARRIECVQSIDGAGIMLSSGARYSIKDGGGAGENNIVKYVPGHVAHVFEGGWVTNGEYANMISAAKSIKCGESVVICEKDGTVRTVAPTPATAPTRRAPGAGRPRLTAPTKQVFGRIPAALLPELIKRGGVARILIDALSKKLT